MTAPQQSAASITLDLATLEDIAAELDGRLESPPYLFARQYSPGRWQAILHGVSPEEAAQLLSVLRTSMKHAVESGDGTFAGRTSRYAFQGRCEVLPERLGLWQRLPRALREFVYFLAACGTCAALLRIFG